MATLHEKLNIRVPIWNAGMGIGIAGPALAAAVSNARGLGVLGAGGLPDEEIQQQMFDNIKWIKEAKENKLVVGSR